MAGTWQVHFEDLLLIICKKLWEPHMKFMFNIYCVADC